MATAPVKFSGAEMSLLKALRKAQGKKTYAELAESIGKTEGTVKQGISAIRSKFKEATGGKSLHSPVDKGGMGIPDVVKKGGRGAQRGVSFTLDEALAQLSDDSDSGDDEENESEAA